MDAGEEATASHGRRDRKRWSGEKESICEGDARTKPCRLRRRETQGQSARTLSPGSGGRRTPRPLLRLASSHPHALCARSYRALPLRGSGSQSKLCLEALKLQPFATSQQRGKLVSHHAVRAPRPPPLRVCRSPRAFSMPFILSAATTHFFLCTLNCRFRPS
jgi:hypothetical protein